MRFRTKFGAITISDKVGKEYESLTRIPLSHYVVERIVDNLPDKDKSAKSLIEQGIIDDAKIDAEELAEMDRINASGKGITINMGHTGLMLDVDDNGNFMTTRIHS